MDVRLKLPIELATTDLRANTGLGVPVQRAVFAQPGCRDVCEDLLRRPAHLVLPEPLTDAIGAVLVACSQG